MKGRSWHGEMERKEKRDQSVLLVARERWSKEAIISPRGSRGLSLMAVARDAKWAGRERWQLGTDQCGQQSGASSPHTAPKGRWMTVRCGSHESRAARISAAGPVTLSCAAGQEATRIWLGTGSRRRPSCVAVKNRPRRMKVHTVTGQRAVRNRPWALIVV